ncbi:MAG TPA: ATP-binding protein [Solirubrobacteraceae bacterium]|jgi:signal transduction histidine kinase|nr:ATP-binding protein [Solirubrobacteraceae bacterium]
MTTQRQSTAKAMTLHELDRVERAFAEAGLLAGDLARQAAHEEAAAGPLPETADAGARAEHGALLLARALLARAPSEPALDAGRLARLVDRLAADLDMTRARVARALLLAGGEQDPPQDGFAADALLALLEAADRRLARLGFDLHDGPLQELLLLGEDMRMFREQLASVLGVREEARLLRGRLEDLEARSVALERGLRQISAATGASAPADRPFAEAVRELADAFAARTGIVPDVRLVGAPAGMSASQRIALLSVVGEALNNVREHGRTVSRVEVAIRLGAGGVGARVRDDGCGFDVEAALLDAARRGRIGLAGIYERVRLLDGECVVESRPGGPTTVSLKLPRWEQPGAPSLALGGV